VNRWLISALVMSLLAVPAAYVLGEHAGKKEGVAEYAAKANRALAEALANQGEVLTKALEKEKANTIRERQRYNQIVARLKDEKTCGDPVPACLRVYLDSLRD